jgi:nucleoside-diphosphate-sugar epimerase
MVETVLAVSGSRAAPVYGAAPLRPGEPECYVAAVARTRALTGWEPRYDLRRGVEQTWDWFRQHAGRRAA